MRARWLLSFLLLNLPHPCAAAAPPAAPSNLECYIPKKDSKEDIQCFWDRDPDPQTNYSLHWEPANSEDVDVKRGVSQTGFIHRDRYTSYSDVRVWVQAKNQQGSVRSKDVEFNTGNISESTTTTLNLKTWYQIKKPSPPENVSSQQRPLELFWSFSCEQEPKGCDIRYRMETEEEWNEDTEINHESYPLDSLQHGVVYEFQVRCGCKSELMSNWSSAHRLSSEAAPVGTLDVWKDCGMFPSMDDCVLTWKTLPLSHARGHILGYEVLLRYNSGGGRRQEVKNLSSADPSGLLVCEDTQCYFNSSLKNVLSASVSAYNAHGSTTATHLEVPTTGRKENEQVLHCLMDQENLSVSWDQIHEDLDYLVHVKEAGSPPGRGFNWIRISRRNNTGEMKVHFRNNFKKFTPYQVCVFTVSQSGETTHRSSQIQYSVQRPSPAVPSFKVASIHPDGVTLSWQQIPLLSANGLTLYYQIGVNQLNVVYKVNVSHHHLHHQENLTFKLLDLKQNQEYVVWIRAVNQAGPGPNVTITFSTNPPEDQRLVYLIPVLIIILAVICFPLVLSFCKGESKACPLFLYEKVPDPNNSHIFRQMKFQINDPLAPFNEPYPHISLLEVVEIQPGDPESTSHPDGLTGPAGTRREDQVPEERRDRTGPRRRKEEYSTMVDSDDDEEQQEEEEEQQQEEEEESINSSDEEQFTSGYEKHFMPTVLEVLEV